jgi:tetratricopeptide (TPR) repeat protein
MAQNNAPAAQQDAERALQIALLERRLTGEQRQDLLARLYMLHSQAHAVQKNWDRASEAIGKALEVAPDNVDALLLRGRWRYERGDVAGALSEFEQVLAAHGHSAAAYQARGVARNAQGDNEGALADFDQALRLEPKNGITLSNRGLVRLKLGQVADGEFDLWKALVVDPSLSLTRVKLAEALRKRHQYPIAQRLLQKGLQLNAQDPLLLLASATRDIELDQYEKAFDKAAIMLKVNPNDTRALNLRGTLNIHAGRLGAAVSDLKRVLEFEAGHTEAQFNLALAYMRLRQNDAALAAIEQLLAIEPHNAQAQTLKDQIWRNKEIAMTPADWENELARALAAQDQVAEARVRNELGSQAAHKGDTDGAMHHFERVVEIGRSLPDARLNCTGLGNLGGVYFAAGRREEAIAMLHEACAMARELGSTRHVATFSQNLGEFYRQTMRPREALTAFEEAQVIFTELGDTPDPILTQAIQELRNLLKG